LLPIALTSKSRASFYGRLQNSFPEVRMRRRGV
jgi:hypothetical protein